MFRCRVCRRKFKERTGTPFHHLEFLTDIVFQVLLCRLRYQLSLRHWAELFLLRGFECTHQAVQEWEAAFLAEQESIRFRGRGSLTSGNGPTSSVDFDLPIAPRAGRDQPHDLAAFAGFQ